jgi:hypothetical protein
MDPKLYFLAPPPGKVSCGGGLCRFYCSKCICISLMHPTEPCGGRDDVRGDPVSGWPYSFRKVRHICSVTYYTPFLWGRYLLSKRWCRDRVVVVSQRAIYCPFQWAAGILVIFRSYIGPFPKKESQIFMSEKLLASFGGYRFVWSISIR